MSVKLILKSALLLISLYQISTAQAFTINSPNFRISGYGTLGLSQSDSDTIYTRDVASQKGVLDELTADLNSNLGLQINYMPTDDLKFGLQLVAKDRPENSLDKTITWAYLGYQITPEWEFRIGRKGTNAFLLSDYKNVGYTQLWTHAPIEFYGQFSGESGDGIALIYDTEVAGGFFRAQSWLNQGNFYHYTDGVIPFKGKPAFGLTTSWENDTWRYSATYFRVKFREKQNTSTLIKNVLEAALPLWPEIEPYIDDVSLDDSYATYYGLGAAYTDNGWTIQSEMSLTETKSAFSNRSKSAYLLVGKKFGSVTPFTVAAFTRNDHVHIPAYQDNPFVPAFVNAGGHVLQANMQEFADLFNEDQKTLSFGARWDVVPNVALKAQWDRTWVKPYAGGLTGRPQALDSSETINRFVFTVDFVY